MLTPRPRKMTHEVRLGVGEDVWLAETPKGRISGPHDTEEVATKWTRALPDVEGRLAVFPPDGWTVPHFALLRHDLSRNGVQVFQMGRQKPYLFAVRRDAEWTYPFCLTESEAMTRVGSVPGT